MADFNFYLNRQGVRGQQGPQGPQGFSPIITEYTNTLSEYVLQIQTQNNIFLTANLREHKDDLGGTYIRYNRETGVMYAGFADVASQETTGMARFSTSDEVTNLSETTIATPADVNTLITNSAIAGDIADLEVTVQANSDAIGALENSVAGLLSDYVPKARTINGHPLSSNVTITAGDVGAYTTSQTDSLLSDKADISDIPVVPTNVSSFTNDAGYITSSYVGNGTITFTQGGVTKGSITTNQSGDATIALDAGGNQYVLPPATTSTLGGVIVDGTTITVDSNGVISSVGGGGGGGATYNPGNGININSSTNTISAKPDGTTIDFNSSGELKVINAPTPNNMVTTDTTQTITGLKTFDAQVSVNGTILARYTAGSSQRVEFHPTMNGAFLGLYTTDNWDGKIEVGGSGSSRYMNIDAPYGSTDLRINSLNNATTLALYGSNINTVRNSSTYTNVDSGNIGSYALTSLPTATTSILGGVIPDGRTITVDADGTIHGASTYTLPTASTQTLGGVKVDGTSITINASGVISSSGGGGGTTYTGGDGIAISNQNVISVNYGTGLSVGNKATLPNNFTGSSADITSSSQGPGQSNYQAFDGSESTFWGLTQAPSSGSPAWIMRHHDAIQVTSVDILFTSEVIQNIKVFGSNDGTTFTQIGFYDNNTSSRVTVPCSASQTYTYTKIEYTQAYSGWGQTLEININYLSTAPVLTNSLALDGITRLLPITQTDYDNLQTKDANTFYIIIPASNS